MAVTWCVVVEATTRWKPRSKSAASASSIGAVMSSVKPVSKQWTYTPASKNLSLNSLDYFYLSKSCHLHDPINQPAALLLHLENPAYFIILLSISAIVWLFRFFISSFSMSMCIIYITWRVSCFTFSYTIFWGIWKGKREHWMKELFCFMSYFCRSERRRVFYISVFQRSFFDFSCRQYSPFVLCIRRCVTDCVIDWLNRLLVILCSALLFKLRFSTESLSQTTKVRVLFYFQIFFFINSDLLFPIFFLS